jgi:uncharacterized phage protein (TIGR01671 family)
MREIKFRAWDKKRKIMLYNVVFAIHKDLIAITDQNCCGIGFDGYFKIFFQNCQPINQIVLMQYTGFKDKKGKEIYEGDIVKSTLEYNAYTGMKSEIYGGQVYEVIWKNAKFKLSPLPMKNHFFSWNDLEVIGNIFENPELLKVKNK